MEQVLAVAGAAALSSIGFLVQRWMRKAQRDETLSRRLKVLRLYNGMKLARLERQDLKRLERELTEEQ